jgi:hypothetical protein
MTQSTSEHDNRCAYYARLKPPATHAATTMTEAIPSAPTIQAAANAPTWPHATFRGMPEALSMLNCFPTLHCIS